MPYDDVLPHHTKQVKNGVIFRLQHICSNNIYLLQL